MFTFIRFTISFLGIVGTIIVLALVLGFVLNVDDLAACGPHPSLSGTCRAADAVVAISGGDTGARAHEAIKLYKAGWAPHLIFSGAAQDQAGLSNAAAMRLQALGEGVSSSVIWLDEASVDTADNAKKIKQIVESQGLHRIILVTSPYHQRRASIEFTRTLGPQVQVVNHPTPDDISWPSNWWLTPTGWWLALSETVKVIFVSLGGHN